MALLPDISVGAVDGDDPKKQIESLVKQMNEWGRILSNEDRTNITKDDAGDNRILFGFQQDGFDNGDVGGKMSQAGVDVLTATSDQLIWSTDFNNFKIVDSGTVTIPQSDTYSAAGTDGYQAFASVTVEHNLGYNPMVLAFVDSGIGYTLLPYTFASTAVGGGIQIEVTKAFVDDVEVNFVTNGYKYGPGWSASGFMFESSIKYYLLRETAN